jgi:hypothetical protein
MQNFALTYFNTSVLEVAPQEGVDQKPLSQ